MLACCLPESCFNITTEIRKLQIFSTLFEIGETAFTLLCFSATDSQFQRVEAILTPNIEGA